MFVDAVSNGDVFGMIKIGVACFVKESRCQMPQQVEVAIVNRLAGRDPAVVSVSRGRFGILRSFRCLSATAGIGFPAVLGAGSDRFEIGLPSPTLELATVDKASRLGFKSWQAFSWHATDCHSHSQSIT